MIEFDVGFFDHLPTRKESKESWSKGHDCIGDTALSNIKYMEESKNLVRRRAQ